MKNIRNICLLGALAIAVLLPTQVWATVFNYTGAIETWVAPTTGTYRVTAVGAQGGQGTVGAQSYVGGRGAQIVGSFNFITGDSFSLAVGGVGSSLADQFNGGGGGGSFFVSSADDPLLIAGGGGGIRSYAGRDGFDASITEYGVMGSGYYNTGPMVLKTIDLGLGGEISWTSYGSAGAGFYSDGADDSVYGTGGRSWANGILGGSGNYSGGCNSFGGFGGGGSGSGCGGGGGGGGYSGGDGGFIAGGGGSFNAGFDQLAIAGFGYGDGWIEIELLSSATPVPEPSTYLLLGSGIAGLIVWRRKRKHTA